MKNRLIKIFLILLPVMAVLLATTGDSVTVYDTVAKTTASYSYFALIDVGTLQMCTPLAGILAIVTALTAVAFAVTGKPGCVKAVFWMAFLSATVAMVPVLSRGDVLVVPNALFAILMLCTCIPATMAKKNPADRTKEKTGPRLGGK